MTKSEIIADVLNKVSEETEIEVSIILSSCRQQEIVDARHIAIVLISNMGVYPAQTAKTFNVSTRNIYMVKSAFNNRLLCNKPLRIIYERILKKLRGNFETAVK